MVEAYITPEVLTWARERRQLAAETLSKGIASRPETIVAWESGEARPTFKQAQRLAGRLRVPLGYLFLSEPPALLPQIPDLRRPRGGQPPLMSLDFVDLLNDVLTKQQWFREYRQAQGAGSLDFIGKYKAADDVVEVAADIRETLGVNDAMRTHAANWEAFIRDLIGSAEEKNILALRSGVVANNTHRPLDVEEFRGFAISDDIAPLIFLNSRDYKAAQIFTLAHELAHLWIGVTGISNPDYRLRSSEQGDAVERQCNAIAAEMLVPEADFLQRWRIGQPTQTQAESLARHYKVSSMVTLRRAYEAGVIDSTEYWQQYDALLERMKGKSTKESGGDAYATYITRNSRALTVAVLESVADGTTLHSEAARLLNIRVETLDGLRDAFLAKDSAVPGYWIDSSVMIEACKGPYAFDIAPGFWEMLDRNFTNGVIASSVSVHDEIKPIGDLYSWIRNRSNFFVEPAHEAQMVYRNIADYVQAHYRSDQAAVSYAGQMRGL